MTLGLRSLDLANWFEVDEERLSELAEKRLLLETRLQDVAALLPAGASAAHETAELAVSNLRDHWPQFDCSKPGEVHDREAGETVRLADANPLIPLARLLQEDFAVMSPIDGEWRLTAAVLCSPSRWRLAEKLGKGLDGIHQPVPGYQEQIGSPVAAMFDKLLVERPMWRANWTLNDDPRPFQPEPAAPRWLDPQRSVADQVYFRVERQTIRKLPQTGAIAFTIRTYIRSLREVVASEPAARGQLAAAIRATEPAHAEYRGWQRLGPQVLDWLESV